jgi:hypothetical protein
MAKVWPVYEGGRPNVGRPWAVLPRDDVVRVLHLEPQHFLAEPASIPTFGDKDQDLSWVGYKHVVAEIGEDEADVNWPPGYYRSPLTPSQAFYQLLAWRIGVRVGPHWRVELEEGTDADGDPAVWAWITLKRDAADDAWDRVNRETIETTVRQAMAESGIGHWVFVRFRKEAEEAAAS